MVKYKIGVLILGAFLFLFGAYLTNTGSDFARYSFIGGLVCIVLSVYLNVKYRKN